MDSGRIIFSGSFKEALKEGTIIKYIDDISKHATQADSKSKKEDLFGKVSSSIISQNGNIITSDKAAKLNELQDQLSKTVILKS